MFECAGATRGQLDAILVVLEVQNDRKIPDHMTVEWMLEHGLVRR